MLTRMLFIGSLLVLGCADDKGTTPPAEVGDDIELVNWT